MEVKNAIQAEDLKLHKLAWAEVQSRVCFANANVVTLRCVVGKVGCPKRDAALENNPQMTARQPSCSIHHAVWLL